MFFFLIFGLYAQDQSEFHISSVLWSERYKTCPCSKLYQIFNMSISIIKSPGCCRAVIRKHSNRYILNVCISLYAQDHCEFHLLSYLPNPSARAGYDTRSIFKRSLTGFNSKYSFSKTSCLTKAEEPSLPYYLPTAGGRIIGVIPFPRVLVLCEMQSVSSRIWTRVAVSISYDDNHYTTGTSNFIYYPCFYVRRDL